MTLKRIIGLSAALIVWALSSPASAATLIDAQVGNSVSYGLTGNPRTTISTEGSLPPGISLGLTFQTTRGLVGVPTTTGVYSFTVVMQICSTTCGSPVREEFIVTVAPMVQVRLQDANVGSFYSVPTGVSAPGSTTRIVAGALPSGLTLSPGSSQTPPKLSGFPTDVGFYRFQLENAYCSLSCSSTTTDHLLFVGFPSSIPTQSEWAMILFGLLLAGAGGLHLRHRRFTP